MYILDSLKSMQENLRLEGANRSLSGIRKGIKKGVLMPERKLRQNLSARRTWQSNMHRPKSIDIITQPTSVNGSFMMRPESICGDLMVTLSLIGW